MHTAPGPALLHHRRHCGDPPSRCPAPARTTPGAPGGRTLRRAARYALRLEVADTTTATVVSAPPHREGDAIRTTIRHNTVPQPRFERWIHPGVAASMFSTYYDK